MQKSLYIKFVWVYFNAILRWSFSFGRFIGRIGDVSFYTEFTGVIWSYFSSIYLYIITTLKYAVFRACLTQVYYILLLPLITFSLLIGACGLVVIFIIVSLYIIVTVCAFFT